MLCPLCGLLPISWIIFICGTNATDEQGHTGHSNVCDQVGGTNSFNSLFRSTTKKESKLWITGPLSGRSKTSDQFCVILPIQEYLDCLNRLICVIWFQISIFEVKLAFEMLTVRGQQHSFLTHERVFLWKCQSFWDRKCLDLRGTRTPMSRPERNSNPQPSDSCRML